MSELVEVKLTIGGNAMAELRQLVDAAHASIAMAFGVPASEVLPDLDRSGHYSATIVELSLDELHKEIRGAWAEMKPNFDVVFQAALRKHFYRRKARGWRRHVRKLKAAQRRKSL